MWDRTGCEPLSCQPSASLRLLCDTKMAPPLLEKISMHVTQPAIMFPSKHIQQIKQQYINVIHMKQAWKLLPSLPTSVLIHPETLNESKSETF